jgi:heme-degrading monooxygenase HmoA
MYAKVTIAQSHPDAVKSGEAGKIYRDSILPETQQLRGYKGTLLLTDQVTGKGLTITLFETEADLKASDESDHYERQIAKLAHLLITPHLYEAYEVVIHDIEGKIATAIARGTFGQLQAGTDKQEDAIELFRDAVLPELKQHAGFKGALFLIDRATGKAMSLGLWATEAQLKANEQSGSYHRQLAKLGHLFSAPAVRELFEATFHNLT